MGFIDAIVDRSFRDTPSGRIVVFFGDSRKQGYLVRSAIEEQKIRSFLKMFYFAHLYNLVYGIMVSQSFASWFTYELFERPARHLLGSMSICLGIYVLVVGVPYTFLWRAYKRGLRSYSAPADEVMLTGTDAPGRQWIVLVVAGFSLLIFAVILILAVRPRVP